MTLMAHKDTANTPENEVKLIPAPEWTDTWHPVSHAQLIDATDLACKEVGIGVVDKRYSLNKTGTKMFASWSLDVGNGKIGYVLGFRHSTDRSMRIGFVAGTQAFICDNMCFTGDYIAFRMHTGGLDMEELELMAMKALEGAIVQMEDLHRWQTDLHEIYVPRTDLKCLVFDMVEQGVFSGGQISNYLSCLDEERKIRYGYNLDGATSLYSVHGAATRLMRPWNMIRSAAASAKLQGICDGYIENRAA